MKKTPVALLCLLLLMTMALLSACSSDSGNKDLSDSKYVGTWTGASMTLGEESGEFEEEATLVINGDGTGEMSYAGETGSFTWEPVSGGFKTKGDVKATFKDEDTGIVTKIIGVELHFVKAE